MQCMVALSSQGIKMLVDDRSFPTERLRQLEGIVSNSAEDARGSGKHESWGALRSKSAIMDKTLKTDGEGVSV